MNETCGIDVKPFLNMIIGSRELGYQNRNGWK